MRKKVVNIIFINMYHLIFNLPFYKLSNDLVISDIIAIDDIDIIDFLHLLFWNAKTRQNWIHELTYFGVLW